MMKMTSIGALVFPAMWGSLLTAVLLGGAAMAADDVGRLSDEFDDANTLDQWRRVYQAEGWGFDQLERWDIDTTRPGHMFMMPHTSSWYAEWRGVQVYKAVEGDFVVTTDVTPTRRGGGGPPNASYSLAGILVRTPRPEVTGPATWTFGGENYIFLSLGAANTPGTYQFEVKTTTDSVSVLEISAAAAGRARIQIARVGSSILALRQFEGGPWEVHRRYARPDMPDMLHAGLTTYTDWEGCSLVGYEFHNTHLLTNGLALPGGGTLFAHPDLEASFDYLRFARPRVPAHLADLDLADAGQVSNADLLSFLGDSANIPGGSATPARLESAFFEAGNGFVLTLQVESNRSYRVQWTASLPADEWTTLTNFVSRSASRQVTDASAPDGRSRFYRVISP